MSWLRRALSLRAKITATFTLIVVGGTLVSTLIGSRIITNALLDQARSRGRQGLEAAQAIYRDQLDGVHDATVRAASEEAIRDAVRSGSDEALAAALARARDAAGLSFLSYTDASGRVLHAGTRSASALAPALEGPVRAALGGETVTSTEALDAATLAAEDASLVTRARIGIDASAGEAGTRAAVVTNGLVLFSAVPVAGPTQPVGALYGGSLLNNRHELVDRVEQLLYGRERYRDRQVGTVAILLRDVWIATNITRPDGRRATGTVLASPIASTLLESGRGWSGVAPIAGEPYVASITPIRDHAGRVVGALYVGVLTTPFLAARTDVMLTFLIVCLIGLVIVFALTYWLTRTTIHPLEEMVAATKRISAGDLDVTVNVASRDEIGELAGSFNEMLANLKRVNRELQDSALTLEAKVRQRTEELVSVQAQMARSEKLASVGRLAAGVAHSINNPLGGILSLAMLALEDMPPDHPLQGDLDTIVKQTLRCREVVKGLLDFSRQSEVRMTRTDIDPIVDGTLALIGRQVTFDNINVVRLRQDGLPPVLIDPGQLQEVIVNIVINAADAMEEHGELTVETAEDRPAGEIVIHITDTGKGIAPEMMPFLFEPFFTTKTVGKGTGLGLAIAHGVVTRAGGRIDVSSRPGETTFTVRLPIAREEEDHGAAAPADSGTRQPAAR